MKWAEDNLHRLDVVQPEEPPLGEILDSVGGEVDGDERVAPVKYTVIQAETRLIDSLHPLTSPVYF